MRTYTDYVKSKHQMFFRSVDLGGDGKLYKKNFMKRVDNMSNLNVANEDESQNTRYRWVKIDNFLFFFRKDDEVLTEGAYIQRLEDVWASDLYYEFSLLITGIYDILFDRLDANRDGCISEDELKLYYNSIGAASDQFVGKVFRKLDEDKDGMITKNEFLKAGSLFWFSDDSSTGMEIMYNVHN